MLLVAPEARRTRPPQAWGDEPLVGVGFERSASGFRVSWSARVPKVLLHYCYSRASRQAVPGGGDFSGAPRSADAGAVRAAHFVNILTEAV